MIAHYLSKASLIKAIVLSGAIIGIADGLAAITSAYFSRGITPDIVFKYVASGAVGNQAFEGGIAMITLGILFHFFIALSFTALFFIVASELKFLLQKMFLSGMVYGIFIWLVMNFGVIPLSQTPTSTFRFSQVVVGLLIHIFVIGIPIVWLAKQHLAKPQMPL
jgi:hypothetical protein